LQQSGLSPSSLLLLSSSGRTRTNGVTAGLTNQ
jgi:hypothetical protein